MSPSQYGRLLESLLEQAAGYARSILRNRHDAEDAVQQAALRGLERLASYEPDRPFKAWWFAILRNCCIDLFRSPKPVTLAMDSLDSGWTPSRQHEDWEELALAIERIAPQHAEILRLRYFGNLSYRELSQALAIPQGTVMSRLHYARKALIAETEREGNHE